MATQTKTLTKTATKVATKIASKTTLAKPLIPLAPIVITLENGKKIALTKKELEASIGWKQGFMFRLWYPPFSDKSILNTRKPIAGVHYYKGLKSAYKSIAKIGKGTLPPKLARGMGIVNVEITTGKEGKPRIEFPTAGLSTVKKVRRSLSLEFELRQGRYKKTKRRLPKQEKQTQTKREPMTSLSSMR